MQGLPPYERVEPLGRETPVVVEVPHGGLHIDPETLAFTVAPAFSVARDADLYVDELCADTPAEGASLLVARYSRFVVDLNRAESNVDGEAVEGGGRAPLPRGLIWRLTTDGDPIITRALPRSELERRLNLVYRPYHRTLDEMLAAKQARFGYAVLLCVHSMPSDGRMGHLDPGVRRADLVPGSRGRTSAAAAVIDTVDAIARAQGFEVRHDVPYRGGFATAHYGRPSAGVHAIQVEVARRRYMDEGSFRRDLHGFARVKGLIRSFVGALGALPAEHLRPPHAPSAEAP